MIHDIRKYPHDRIIVSPSILSADFARLGDHVAEAENAGCDILHLDVMDGHFVPNLTFGPPLVAALRKRSGLLFDTHLMLTDPVDYVKPFADSGSDHITFHIEANGNPFETIAEIRGQGCTAGISLKPGTPASALEKVLPYIDMVLVMTVEPGFGGQSFMRGVVPKIGEIAGMAKRLNPALYIEVDGGIDPATAPEVVRMGANVLVAGSAVFRAKQGISAAIDTLHSYSEMLPSAAASK